MRLRIRSKFIGILVLAVVLPLGLTPLFVVVSRSADEVFGPVRRQILLLGIAGSVLVLV